MVQPVLSEVTMNQATNVPQNPGGLGAPDVQSMDGVGLPKMDGLSNAELREVLANPDIYIPEAVHSAARELAARHAIPRYYTRLHSRHFPAVINVGRTWNPNLITKLQLLFSEKQLKKICMAVVITHSVYITLRTIEFARWLKHMTLDTYAKHMEYIVLSSIALISSTLITLFFFVLYRTLTIRSIKAD
jgi:hypothetical protein